MKAQILSVERDCDGQIVLRLSTGVDAYLPIYDKQNVSLVNQLTNSLRGAEYNDFACNCNVCTQDCPMTDYSFGPNEERTAQHEIRSAKPWDA